MGLSVSRGGLTAVQFRPLSRRYREGQEDQLGALGLVVNAIVLWNTRYIDAALRHLRETGVDGSPDDVVRLSPDTPRLAPIVVSVPLLLAGQLHERLTAPGPPLELHIVADSETGGTAAWWEDDEGTWLWLAVVGKA